MYQLENNIFNQSFIEMQIPELFQTMTSIEQLSPLKVLKINQELQLIEQAIQAADGNLDIAAQNLNISRTTLWRKMKLLKA